MEIHIYANQQQMGPFEPDAVVDMARMGSLPGDASVWHDGAEGWYPLSDFMAKHAPAAARAVPVATAPASVSPALNPPSTDGPSRGACVARGIGAGFLLALVGGVSWAGVSFALGFRIPFVGLAIGWGVGRVTSWASRGENNVLLPISAVVWTLLACTVLSFGSIWGIISLVFALGYAWREASQ